MRLAEEVIRIATCVAVIVATIVAVTPPAASFVASYARHAGELEAQAHISAEMMSQLVSRSPQLWRYETIRMADLLARAGGNKPSDNHRVIDAHGVALQDVRPPEGLHRLWPRLVRSETFYDSGRLAGRVEHSRCLQDLITRTGLLALLSCGSGVALFFAARVYPLRSLTGAWAKIAYLASHDTLTSLPNRILFRDRLQQAIFAAQRRGDWISVLCLDLDHFKDVNDTLGHPAGDLLLQQVAHRLRAKVRACDTLGRLSGDEFAIVQTDLRRAEPAAQLAQRIIEELAEPFELNGNRVSIACSIGIAIWSPEGAPEPETLMRNADLALYRAKEQARGMYCFFDPEMETRFFERKTLEQELTAAVAAEALQVYYQPQIATDTSQLIGVEALLRWPHPQRGFIPPVDFIPVAEETGLMSKLGEWVLRRACLEAAPWRPLRLAVNLSPVQFRTNLVEVVRRVLAETNFEPERLELEITEGVLLQDTDATVSTLRGLRDLGVHIAMDDFGTGYSSLSYLHKFPFDKIKIDRSFIQNAENKHTMAIIRATISLTRSLGIRSNVEGVETREQYEVLQREGCEEVQGFLFGRPMPAEHITRQIAQTRAGDDAPGDVGDSGGVDGGESC